MADEETREETRRVRYYLVNNDCFELAVNFKYLTFTFYQLDSIDSTEEEPALGDLVLSSGFSAESYTTHEELSDNNKNLLTRIAINLAKQALNFKYKEKFPNDAIISIVESYDKAYERWSKTFKDTKLKENECKLEDVILDDETKEDILRTINFVKKMADYKEIGCTLPSGILLEGEPGTGKTLISKTIASEGNMHFTSVVGSDFVQKYVGESAKRVQKVFDELKDQGGGVLFIDEIDAIGGNRNSHDDNKEYRACLNKLLACMSDAAENNIIVIGATNVKDQLDPALIREGRIDQIINIPLPDFESRVKLFELYVGKLKHEENIDYKLLAEKSEGKSGAFIASVCNHAGMYAVDKGFKQVNQEHLDHTISKMLRDDKDNSKTIGFV